VQLIGTDSDVPVQNLRYSLESGAPAGMSVDAVSGLLSWTATASYIGTNTVTVRVSDDGTPPMSATRSFDIVVGGKPKLEVSRIGANGELLKISFDSLPNKRYQIESTDSIASNWQTNATLIGTGSKLSVTNSMNPQKQKFFRARILD
ncbi:MAG: putative Ig domain-containing protein, partial [Verrucomicrobiia bacterium]